MAKKISNILLPYENKWVAVTPRGDKVVAAASDVKTLDKKLRRMGKKEKGVVMLRVFPFDGFYSPFNVS